MKSLGIDTPKKWNFYRSSIRGAGLPLSVHHNTAILTPERFNVPQGTVSASTTQLNDSVDHEDNDNGTSAVPGALSQSTDSSLLDWWISEVVVHENFSYW